MLSNVSRKQNQTHQILISTVNIHDKSDKAVKMVNDNNYSSLHQQFIFNKYSHGGLVERKNWSTGHC